MRDLINLIEGYSGIPDFSQFITPELIENLIKQGSWSAHGASLDEWWEEGAGDFMTSEEFENASDDYETALKTDPDLVKRTLTKFLHARVGFIKKMMNGEYGNQIITPDADIKRVIMVSEDYIRNLETMRSETIQIGIYWGSDEVEAWGARYDNIHHTPYALEFTTKLKHTQVNWFETFLSRIDWSNGDDENEIQLVKNSPIDHISEVRVTASNADRSYLNKVLNIDPTVRWMA